MLEMNRTEFEKELSNQRAESEKALAALQEQLKAERAEKASALQQLQALAPHATAPIGDSPDTSLLDDTLTQLQAEVARRDSGDDAGVRAEDLALKRS